MVRWKEGIVVIEENTVIFPKYTFEDFRRTPFYNGQTSNRVVNLDKQITIDGHGYMVEIFFRNGNLYMLSLVCCEKSLSMEQELERKEIHDKILEQYQIHQNERFCWGRIASEYDARGGISSINFYYN